MEILDSGTRREFDSGAVRDVVEGKGRCDLLPLDVVSRILRPEEVKDEVLYHIDKYVRTGKTDFLYLAVVTFVKREYADIYTAILEVAKHYEDGANKYAERNWEKGIPLHCYIDSGVRHYLKHSRGDKDEPHDRAFIWNMLGAIWTHTHTLKPELFDLPFRDVDCPHREWFGDMGLHYCDKDNEICEDVTQCGKD